MSEIRSKKRMKKTVNSLEICINHAEKEDKKGVKRMLTKEEQTLDYHEVLCTVRLGCATSVETRHIISHQITSVWPVPISSW